MVKRTAWIANPPARVPATVADEFVIAGQPDPFPPPTSDEAVAEKPKRLTIDIAPSLHRAFKVTAATEGVDMRDLMIRMIEGYVEKTR